MDGKQDDEEQNCAESKQFVCGFHLVYDFLPFVDLRVDSDDARSVFLRFELEFRFHERV